MGFERGWQYEDAQVRALRRMAACAYTASAVASDLAAPKSIEDKADLLVAAEELYAEAEKLVTLARAIAWGDVKTDGQEVQAE